MPKPSVVDPRPVKDVLADIALRIRTIEGALRLLREGRDVSERYDPIPPFK